MSELHIFGKGSPIFFQHGVVGLGDNSGMRDHEQEKPNIAIMRQEEEQRLKTLHALGIVFAIKPASLKNMLEGNNDDVFTKDTGVSLERNGKPEFILSSFAPHVQASRGMEVEAMQGYINALAQTAESDIHIAYAHIPNGECFEGGEHNTIMENDGPVIIYGTRRATMGAQQWILRNFNVADALHVESEEEDAYHVDTITCIVDGEVQTLLGLCKEVVTQKTISNAKELCQRRNWELVDIAPKDSIGPINSEGKRTGGTYACNGVSFTKGTFISGHKFAKPDYTAYIEQAAGAEHIVNATSQYAMSGGSWNCSRFMLNGIPVKDLNIEQANITYVVSQAVKANAALKLAIESAQQTRAVNNTYVKQLKLLTPQVIEDYFAEYDLEQHQQKTLFLEQREQYLDLCQNEEL